MLVVLYQKPAEKSIALQSLLKQQQLLKDVGVNLAIHVWNNSPGVTKPCAGVSWYESENLGLSAVYNRIAEVVFSDGAQLLMISDDDTDYTSMSLADCVKQVDDAFTRAEAQQCGVFLPRLVSHGQLVSPGRRWHFIGRLLPSVPAGFTQSRNLLAINSGVMFTRRCWERMQPFYDERLRFYSTDTDFFIRYEKIFSKVYVLDVNIDHDLSEHSADTVARALFRFSEMVSGLRITFLKHHLGIRALLELYLGYAAVRKAYSYRTWKFISALSVQERVNK